VGGYIFESIACCLLLGELSAKLPAFGQVKEWAVDSC